VHALWLDEKNTLYYSRVLGDEFGNPASWLGATVLAESALDLDVIIDSTGKLHLSYVRPLSSEQFPEGVYYRNASESGQNWSNSILLYQSKYFRSLEREDAHVQISSTVVDGEENIYVAWDNRPIRRVFMTYSGDGGSSWNIPKEVAGPDLVSGNTPFNILLSPREANLLSIFQRGEPGLFCMQLASVSTDQGETWSESEPIYRDVVGCPQDNSFFTLDDGLTLLQSIIQDQVYLIAWDGDAWGIPQKQSALFSFIDTFNNKSVALDCRKMRKVADKLFVVGCDASENGDIWSMSRPIGSITNWFPSPMNWSTPELILSDPMTIGNPILLADMEGRIHATWLQPTENNPNLTIHYSRLIDNNWSEAVSIIHMADDPISYQSAKIDNSGRILIVWSGQKSGVVYFSWANADQADNPSEWADPIPISVPDHFNTSPDISVDGAGTISAVFAVPINEGRGIYFTQSSDEGTSWSQPIIVVDAAENGWDIVSSPKIILDNGSIHLIWNRSSLSNNGEATDLYYASSTTEGISWSTPEIVSESMPLWTDITDAGDSTIHIAWLEKLDGKLLFSDQISYDNGKTWSLPLNISDFSTIDGTIGLIKAADNKLHLIHVGEDFNHSQRLIHWSWDEQGWILEDKIDLINLEDHHVKSLVATINDLGDLTILFIEQYQDSENNNTESLYFSKRLVQLPILISTPSTDSSNPSSEIIPTQTLITNQEPSLTPTPTITPLVTETLSLEPGNNRQIIDNSLALIIGGALAVLLVGTVLLIALFKTKRSG
jgi:hypothetical protein